MKRQVASVIVFFGLMSGQAVDAAPARIAAGVAFSCAVTPAATVTCWGANGFGQVGAGVVGVAVLEPLPVAGLSEVESIGAGVAHACAVTRSTGQVWCWGANVSAQLGRGFLSDAEIEPVRVSGLPPMRQVAAGAEHTCALAVDGRVFCWGRNTSGALGVPVGPLAANPVQVLGLDAVAIASGFEHSCAITRTGGGVYCWGSNSEGQIGNGSTDGTVATPTQVSGIVASEIAADSLSTCAVVGGAVSCWGLGSPSNGTPRPPLPGVNDLASAELGLAHGCGVTTTARLYCWGSNEFGQVGLGSLIYPEAPPTAIQIASPVESVAAGLSHTCAMLANGEPLCWGSNDEGALGRGSNGSVQIEPRPVAVVGDATKISTGKRHACAIEANGELYCWGRNDQGQLGLGFLGGDVASPKRVGGLGQLTTVAAGDTHTCVLDVDGRVWCWGGNSAGQLGIGSVGVPSDDPVELTALPNAVQLDVGENHACIVSETFTVYCWGANDRLQIRAPAVSAIASPVEIGMLANVTRVGVGGRHTCAFVNTVGPYCWGSNDFGQLGQGMIGGQSGVPTLVAGHPSLADLQLGSTHTCALRTDQTVSCWGEDNRGQLGNGPGNATSGQPADIAVPPAIRLYVGRESNCAISSGVTRCWGYSGDYQFGIGGLRFAPDESPSLKNFSSISFGENFTCGLNMASRVACWGSNSNGQLGLAVLPYEASPRKVGPFFDDGFE